MSPPATAGIYRISCCIPPTNLVLCARVHCVWSKIGAVVFGVSQEDITAYGKKHGTEEFKWRACLISCKFVLEQGGLHVPVIGNFMGPECRKLFGYRAT